MRPGTEMFLNADGRLTDGADITSGRLFQMVGPAIPWGRGNFWRGM